MKQVTSKAGTPLFLPSLAEIEAAMENQEGFCIACGEPADGVEPDAHKYTCEACGKPRVYGAEQLVLMGLVSN
jgi:Zn finger protein HypA/HybF involved in hydrogenase expression